MKTGTFTLSILLTLGAQSAFAADSIVSTLDDYLSRLKFSFDERSVNYAAENFQLNPVFQSLNDGVATQYDQFDARMLFPLTGEKYEVGLGVNLRNIQGSASLGSSEAERYNTYNQVIPSFYADALFNLPFKGLSAGFEGSHNPVGANQLLDYRAKLNYKWSDTLNLQGGWEHQQMSFEISDDYRSEYKSAGPYIDFRWRF